MANDHFCKCGHLFENHTIDTNVPQNGVFCTACKCKQYEFEVVAPFDLSVLAQAEQDKAKAS